jgi:hypothetical protein
VAGDNHNNNMDLSEDPKSTSKKNNRKQSGACINPKNTSRRGKRQGAGENEPKKRATTQEDLS